MEPTQIVFDTVLGFVGILIGWVLKILWEGIKETQREIHDLDEKVTNTYVRRDDFKEAISEIKELCSRIFSKLDNKADKQ